MENITLMKARWLKTFGELSMNNSEKICDFKQTVQAGRQLSAFYPMVLLGSV